MVIDAHVHLPLGRKAHQWFPYTRSRADFFKYLKGCGVDRFVAFPSGGDIVETNRRMLRFWRRHPELVIPAVRTDPLNAGLSLREMERAREAGVVWAGEFTSYASPYAYDHPGFEAIVEKADELKMILNVHLLKKEEKPFERVLDRYPDAVFVLAHLWDDRGLVVEKAELIARHPNAYVDLSGYGVDRLGLWEYMIETVGADKVLWGSDYSVNDPAVYLARLGTARIPAADKRKIREGNVRRLLRERGAR